MSNDDALLIKKIEALEADLIAIYREVYPILKKADQTGLPEQVIWSLQNLDPPDTIEPSKATAILVAIRGSGPRDVFQLEWCYSLDMPNGKSLGSFVGDRHEEIGLEIFDFGPYLREHGWVKEK